MEIDLSNKNAREALIRVTEAGSRSECPFCTGRMIASVSVGDRIVLLKGANAGKEATVTAERGYDDYEFFVHIDLEPAHYETRISRTRDKFTFLPIDHAPHWLCALSIDDLSAIDEAVVRTAVLFASEKKPKWSVSMLLPIISVVRSRRLPVSAFDLWPTFEAHDFSSRLSGAFENYFNFAIEMLAEMHGRPPIKRRRVRAMSIGRYLTPTHLEFSGPSPGIKIK